MSETDPSPQSLSKMELAVAIIKGFSIYAESPVLARRLQQRDHAPHFLAKQK